MSYGDSLLANGERVVLRERQHWLAVILNLRWAWLALLVIIGLVWLNSGPLAKGDNGGLVDLLKTGLGYGTLVLFLIGLILVVVGLLNWLNEEYLVTNRRVMKVSGFLNKHSADSSLEKINDAVLDQNAFGRLLGYGDLDILTASDETVDVYKMLSRVVTFKKEILNQKHDLEFEQMRPPVSPPLRAPAMADAPPPPPPAPVVPPPPVPSAMSAAEVTQTLAGLADLRDRGAITPEEFEAKKADLLARL